MEPHDQQFLEILAKTVGLSLVAFATSALMLGLFVRSLHRDNREERSWSRPTIGWLIATVVSLTFFCLLFFWLAFR